MPRSAQNSRFDAVQAQQMKSQIKEMGFSGRGMRFPHWCGKVSAPVYPRLSSHEFTPNRLNPANFPLRVA
jgi:hypothetical protein